MYKHVPVQQHADYMYRYSRTEELPRYRAEHAVT
jgi:hypothetical protein